MKNHYSPLSLWEMAGEGDVRQKSISLTLSSPKGGTNNWVRSFPIGSIIS